MKLNNTLLLPIMDAGVLMCTVRFTKNGKQYKYKTILNDLVKDDQLLVTVSGAYKSVTFVSYIDLPTIDDDIQYKWIIGNVTPMIDKFQRTLDREQRVIDAVNERRKNVTRIQLLAAIGIDNPTHVLNAIDDAAVVDTDDE